MKVAIFVAFGALGLVYATRYGRDSVRLGFDRLVGTDPVVAAAISFVAFQGWQLLFYDQGNIENSVDTIRKAVYVAVPVAVAIYVPVGVVTVNPAPQAIANNSHVALKDAAARMPSPQGLSAVGAVALSLSALFSTGSAINATLFSSAHLAKGMLTDDLLPGDVGDADADGVPGRTALLIGAVTAGFSAVGSLGAITSFASLAFLVVFGVMCYLAFRQRDRAGVHAFPPVVGVVGTATFFPLMLYDLLNRGPHTFFTVLIIAAAVVGVELPYFVRTYLAREVRQIGSVVPGADSEN